MILQGEIYDAITSHIVLYQMLGWLVSERLKRIWKEADIARGSMPEFT
jgi:hypothetical protein